MTHQDDNGHPEFPVADQRVRQPYSAPRLMDLGDIQTLVRNGMGGTDDSGCLDCTAS
jgi:hypothetical protein